MSTSYAAGLAFGIVTALVFFIIIWKFIKKNNMKGKFDERQELVRGRGYKYSAFTLIIMLTVDLIAESYGAFEKLPVGRTLAIFFMILTGVTVYALYCIKNDSYFGVGTDIRTYRAVMWVVIVCNAVSGISGLRSGALVNGKLEFGPWASLLFCLAFAIIMISIGIKQRSMANEEASDEDM